MNYIDFIKRNLRRTPYQTLAVLMFNFLTFFVLSVFILLVAGSQQILRFYESKPQAIAFFKDSVTSEEVTAIQNSLNQTGKIAKFKYVSKDEALQIYRERNKSNAMLLELVTANILPASLEISTHSPEDLKTIAEIVKKEPVVEEVVFPEDVVSSITTATGLIRVVGGSVAIFLITFTTLIIVMIIGFKIRIKREEIETMRLLGASNWFIRVPYLLEGIFYSVIGAFLGWTISLLIVWYFQPLLENNLGEVVQVVFPIPPVFMVELLLIELAAGLVVGSLGSITAVRRYLHF